MKNFIGAVANTENVSDINSGADFETIKVLVGNDVADDSEFYGFRVHTVEATVSFEKGRYSKTGGEGITSLTFEQGYHPMQGKNMTVATGGTVILSLRVD